ncbi:helix-turn-helix transcriptional regulator [Paenibacillus sp. J5C_2022]|uniref:response regulator transcription factor n=1 Tax=Paenibacillus sp. J5C2022 TaxID=2977129 RepID=UPI0021D32FE2|nr:helix-turn-helix transcriptional regulator [Paenibacillus sp. J5C2022]MCU6710633.1 helix-turn-helix transcriptional regulator [Paenibacillus sp. J5C2022]
MNRQLLEQLGHLQDVYGKACRLPITMTDHAGEHLTATANREGTSLQLLAERFLASSQRAQILKDICYIHNPIVYQTEYGFKVIIAPVQAGGGKVSYIWAGPIIERQSRQLIEHACGTVRDSAYIRLALMNIPDTSEEQKQEILERLYHMAGICSTMLQQAEMLAATERQLDEVHRFLQDEHEDAYSAEEATELLREMLELEFSGYACMDDRDGRFCIVHTSGGPPYHSLGGCRFSLGEGFLGQAALAGEARIWERITWDPRTDFFAERGIWLKGLIVYPVKHHQRICGLLFGGVVSDRIMSSHGVALGGVLAGAFAKMIGGKHTEEHPHRQIAYLPFLAEIAGALSARRDVEHVMHTLADAVLTVQGASVSIVIQRKHEEGPVYIVSKGQERGGAACRLEFPMLDSFDRMIGVMTVCLDGQETCEGQHAFLTLLALMGGLFLEERLGAVSSSPHQSSDCRDAASSLVLRLELDNPLTAREREVLGHVLQGLNNQEIAQTLFISAHTVKNHMTKIYEKLEVTDRTQAMAKIYAVDVPRLRLRA